MLLHKRTERVYMAVRIISEYSAIIRNANEMKFNELANRVMAIRTADVAHIGPVLTSGTATQVNNVLTRFISGWSADPHSLLTVLHDAVPAFMTAANDLKDAIGDVVSWTPQGEVYVTVTGTQLETLHASLDALIAAAAVLPTPNQ